MCVFLCLLAKYLMNNRMDINETTKGNSSNFYSFPLFSNKIRSWSSSKSWCRRFFLSGVVASVSAVTESFFRSVVLSLLEISLDLIGTVNPLLTAHHISLWLARPWWPTASLLGEFLRSHSEITQRCVFASVIIYCLNSEDWVLRHTAGCPASVRSNNKFAQSLLYPGLEKGLRLNHLTGITWIKKERESASAP